MGTILNFKQSKTPTTYHLFDKHETVELSKENFKTMCTMNSSPFWNCTPEKRADNNHDNTAQFCWVHGLHTFAGHGEYNLINYSSLSNKEGGFLAATKNWITVRDHNNHEYNFECPKELVNAVIYMLASKPYWLKYVLMHGLDNDLIIHLSRRYLVTFETNRQLAIAAEDYDDKYNGIVYDRKKRNDNNFGGYNYPMNDKHEFILNPLYTEPQMNVLLDILFDEYKTKVYAIYAEHTAKIKEQDSASG